jgi:anti-sigma factor ChrR (cupin superfamily)
MSDPRGNDELLLAALAGLLPEQEPEATVKSRLRNSILAKVRAPTPTTLITRNDEGEWRPLLPGIRIKTLHHDPVTGSQTTLWRVQPGAKVPAHRHSQDEECLLIEGSIVQDGIEYVAGDYLLAQAGSRHTPFESPRGALFLIRGEAVLDASVLKGLIT